MIKKILIGFLFSALFTINPLYSSEFKEEEYEEFSDELEKETTLQSHLRYIYEKVESYKSKEEEKFKTYTISTIRSKYLTPGVRSHGAIDLDLNQILNTLYNHVDEYQNAMLLKLVSTGLIDPNDISLIPKHERSMYLNGKLIPQKEYDDFQRQEEEKKSEKLLAEQKIRDEQTKKIEAEKSTKPLEIKKEEISAEMRSFGIVNFKELALTRTIIEPLFGECMMIRPVGPQGFLIPLIEQTTYKVGGRNFSERKINFLRLLDAALEKENPLKVVFDDDIRRGSPYTNANIFYKKITE